MVTSIDPSVASAVTETVSVSIADDRGLSGWIARLRRFGPRAFLLLWVPAMLVPGAFLLAAHALSLPRPAGTDPRLVAAIAQIRTRDHSDRWIALHVLYEDCGCSRRVLARLLARGTRVDLSERVVMVGSGDGERERLTARGFEYERLTPGQLDSRYHVEAAPVLIVADSRNAVQYIGGYTERKRGPSIRDVEIFERLRAGESVEPLPVLGCAVSQSLRNRVDPLGIR